MRIVLGVTGCIAAYKSAVILRLLQEGGCEVLPVMTEHAKRFLGPLTLEKLSGNRVVDSLFRDSSTVIEHIALARSSDLLLVAPATANTLAKFAHGIGDDFLSTLYISTVTPTVAAPAMNVEMWRHPATQSNLEVLRGRGVTVVEPEAGYLACGEVGEGRLAAPEVIVERTLRILSRGKGLEGKRVLVTAGPTVEDIDPVRFLSNRSSGKMGYAIAAEAQTRGARVTLVSGPTHLNPPPGVELLPVRSAEEMAAAVGGRFDGSEIVIMAAAVGDFAPVHRSREKIKKDEGRLGALQLRPVRDILMELGEKKRAGQFLVGFAAESSGLRRNALEKLRRKRLDLIVANDISRPDRGFASDYNQVLLLNPEGAEEKSPLLTKRRVAAFLWDRIQDRLAARPVQVA